MAKAALNMLTRTSAQEMFETDGILMTAVDTGWITDERPHPDKMRLADEGFHAPLDLVDGAARVYDPIVRGEDGRGPVRRASSRTTRRRTGRPRGLPGRTAERARRQTGRCARRPRRASPLARAPAGSPAAAGATAAVTPSGSAAMTTAFALAPAGDFGDAPAGAMPA